MVIKRLERADEVREILDRARERSERQLSEMRNAAIECIGDNTNIIVGLNGSVARREVTSGSDVDLFFLAVEGNTGEAGEIQAEYREKLEGLGIKMPSQGGVFDEPLAVSDLLENIGGDGDTNQFLTRRMLYLLEGEWLHNQLGFEDVRKRLVDHYVAEDLEDRKLCRYLLNDIIRYWRTICVDFEEKTATGDKPHAIRLIKLRFARMMLYFGGVAAISQTGNLHASQKRELLLKMFAKPPIERLVEVFGEQDTRAALSAYATFIQAVDSEAVRKRLEQSGSSGQRRGNTKSLSVSREIFGMACRTCSSTIMACAAGSDRLSCCEAV